jgi:hypothetical protein
MSVITELAEEVVYMGDLAQAIVALGRAAERRRSARADLIDATDTIADAIREQLRSGDKVEVEGHQDFVSNLISTREVTYLAVSVRKRLTTGIGKDEDALLRVAGKTKAVFGPDKPGAYDLVVAGGEIVHTASDEERQAFVHEANRVVAAFRQLLEEQATKNDTAAKRATKLTPR